MYSLNLRFCITSRSGLTVGHDIWDRVAKRKNEKKQHNAIDKLKSVTHGQKGPKTKNKLHIRSSGAELSKSMPQHHTSCAEQVLMRTMDAQ